MMAHSCVSPNASFPKFLPLMLMNDMTLFVHRRLIMPRTDSFTVDPANFVNRLNCKRNDINTAIITNMPWIQFQPHAISVTTTGVCNFKLKVVKVIHVNMLKFPLGCLLGNGLVYRLKKPHTKWSIKSKAQSFCVSL